MPLSSDSFVRLRIDLSYRGTDFSGWALQPGMRTVQGEVEGAINRLLSHGYGPIRLTVAGRTDAGVHAIGQVAHFDIAPAQLARLHGYPTENQHQTLVRKLAGILPDDVLVTSARTVPAGFDARFSPLSRSYTYRISDRLATRDPLRAATVVWRHRPLDVAAMNTAAQSVEGLHDFAAFCRPRVGATTIRTLQNFRWSRPSAGADAGLVVAELSADAFCHSMVRSLVGSTVHIGEGKRPPAWLAEALESRDRSQAGTVAPAHGLVLTHVEYPADADLAARSAATRARRTPPPTCC